MVKITKEISDIIDRKKAENKVLYDSGMAKEYETMARDIRIPTKPFLGKICDLGEDGESPTIIAQISNGYEAWECEEAGASALAVLVDKYFEKDVTNISLVRSGSDLPILAKDFVIDRVQLFQHKIYGADATLMIPGLVDNKKMKDLIYCADTLGLDCVNEVSSKKEIEEMHSYNGRIMGINNRDLSRLSENDVDLSRTEKLLKYVPEFTNVISLSGFNTFEDVDRIAKTKILTKDTKARPLVCSVVVGRALSGGNPGEKIKELLGV